MKFNCGPNQEERFLEISKKGEALAKWHKVFAWRPIKVASRDCRWLEYVERRYQYVPVDVGHAYGNMVGELPQYSHPEYRAIKK